MRPNRVIEEYHLEIPEERHLDIVEDYGSGFFCAA